MATEDPTPGQTDSWGDQAGPDDAMRKAAESEETMALLNYYQQRVTALNTEVRIRDAIIQGLKAQAEPPGDPSP